MRSLSTSTKFKLLTSHVVLVKPPSQMKDFIFLFTKKLIKLTAISTLVRDTEHFLKGVITIDCHRYCTKSSSVIEYNTHVQIFCYQTTKMRVPKKSTSNVSYLGTILHLMTTCIKSQNLVLAIFITIRTPQKTQEHKLVR